ncbi:MAG: RNA polymerase subunit sigma [Oscillospiraceae bacterium]|nr:RNA polymerase subunit sigma [Oscillospiraceae bacterium]MBQ7130153.1 RNA polymerase subunit sigma [Oscillospiraceae bacterium]
MQTEHQIVNAVYRAKEDTDKADALIHSYMPFIRSQATKFMGRLCTDQDDELSIAMTAFYEAILGYERGRGTFLSYATLLIRSRLIDYTRKEAQHQGQISLDEEIGGEDERSLMDTLADERDYYEESAHREATRQEIEELAAVMAQFDVCFSDVADNCPRQERTMEACAKAIRYAGKNKKLLDELLRTRKLPLAQLVQGSGVERKTLERHRKYILTMLLIQTNGYEILRGHLYHVLKKGDTLV